MGTENAPKKTFTDEVYDSARAALDRSPGARRDEFFVDKAMYVCRMVLASENAPTPQEQPRRFTPTERLVLHDAAEALECDIKHHHSQGCNEISDQLRAMLAEPSESVKP